MRLVKYVRNILLFTTSGPATTRPGQTGRARATTISAYRPQPAYRHHERTVTIACRAHLSCSAGDFTRREDRCYARKAIGQQPVAQIPRRAKPSAEGRLSTGGSRSIEPDSPHAEPDSNRRNRPIRLTPTIDFVGLFFVRTPLGSRSKITIGFSFGSTFCGWSGIAVRRSVRTGPGSRPTGKPLRLRCDPQFQPCTAEPCDDVGPPHFPFFLVLGISLGFECALVLYHALLRLLGGR